MTLMEAKKTGNAHRGRYRRLDLQESTLNRTIFKLATPTILESLLHSMIMMTDTLIAGRLGEPKYLASVALGGLIVYFANSIIHGLGMATSSIVSRAWGEELFEDARRYAGHAIFVAIMVAAGVLLVVYPFAEHLLGLMGAQQEVIEPAAKYMRIIVFSAVLGMPLIISNSVIRAKGDMVTSMCVTGCMNIVNVVVSIVLAFGFGPFPEMGFVGIGIGTVVARTFGGLVSMGILMSHAGIDLRITDVFRLQRSAFARLVHVGWPSMSERFLNTIMYTTFMRMVALLGTVSLAAHEMALTVESLAFMPAWGFGLAATTIVGQAIGAKQPHIAELAVKRTITYSAMLMLVIGIVFVVFADQIVGLFGVTDEVRKIGAIALQISAIELPFLGASLVFSGSLRGAGDTRSPLIASTTSAFVIRLSLVYLFAIVFGWGLAGAWLGAAADWVCRSIGLCFFFNRGVWKVIHEQEKRRFG